MKLNLKLTLVLMTTLVGGAILPTPASAAEVWKTVYYKRGFSGDYNADWAGGLNAVLRTPIPIYSDGTQVRVTLRSSYGADAVLAQMSLVEAAGLAGQVQLPTYGVTFSGAAGVSIVHQTADISSDTVTAPVTAGLWYLQQTYSSQNYPYAFDNNGTFTSPAGSEQTPGGGTANPGVFMGSAYRIDILTTDTRPTIVTYGDSITAGYASTPNTGNQYPQLLAGLVDRPTLNLGVNGDLAQYSGGIPGLIQSLNGVDTLIYLMGINDIITGNTTTLAQYISYVSPMMESLQNNGIKVLMGTILPAGLDPLGAKEALRLTINGWIRDSSGADRVVDFDAAMRDSLDPSKMQSQYYNPADPIHPNDAGNLKMAQIAAAAVPEPATGWMLFLGIGMLAFLRKRNMVLPRFR